MKKAVFGAMMLGIASLGYSQSTNSKIDEVKLSGVEVAPRNLTYWDGVSEGTISDRVLVLEKKASRYNIKEMPFFNDRSKVFYVNFKQNKGNILATYDRDGKILTSSERFKDIALPPAVRNSIYKENPGWTLHSNAYLVSYSHGKDVKKTYKALIRKGNLKKYLRLGVDGNKI